MNEFFSKIFGRKILRAENDIADSNSSGGKNVPTVEASELGINESLMVHHTFTETDIDRIIHLETGRDRIKNILSNKFALIDSQLHPDIQYIPVVMQTGILSGLIFGFISGVTEAREGFRSKNRATKFKSKFTALRAFHDSAFKLGLRRSFHHSFRLGSFIGTYVCMIQLIASYRNKSSVMEYVLSAAFVGGVSRCFLGLRGFFAGSLIGAVLGICGGVPTYLTLRACGLTQEERHRTHIRQILDGKTVDSRDNILKNIVVS